MADEPDRCLLFTAEPWDSAAAASLGADLGVVPVAIRLRPDPFLRDRMPPGFVVLGRNDLNASLAAEFIYPDTSVLVPWSRLGGDSVLIGYAGGFGGFYFEGSDFGERLVGSMNSWSDASMLAGEVHAVAEALPCKTEWLQRAPKSVELQLGPLGG